MLVVVIIDEQGNEIFVISGVLERFCKVYFLNIYVFVLFKVSRVKFKINLFILVYVYGYIFFVFVYWMILI